LDGEAIPLSGLVELAIADYHFDGLLLREVRWLEFFLLQGSLLILLAIVEASASLQKLMSPR
jgi:hypothetical protein